MASQSPRKIKSFILNSRSRKKSINNESPTPHDDNDDDTYIDSHSTRCTNEKCECWIRLKKYCEYFKNDNTTIPQAVDLDQIAEKTKRTSHSQLDSDMTELWQHYLVSHLGEHNYTQCKLHSLCLFLKGRNKHQYYYYRKQSWNLAQTMHVYFYHTKEYMQARGCSARKHRYIRDRTSYRILEPHPMRREHRKSIDIGQSDTPLQNNEIMAQAIKEKDMNPLDLGPGYDNDSIHKEEDQDDDDLDVNQVMMELKANDYYAIHYQSTTTSVSLRALEFGTPFVADQHSAKYKNPKDEILNNQFAKIEKGDWNILLKSCIGYTKKRNAKEIKLTLKEVVGLKLYTDFDELQREYRKCYRENQPDRASRQRQFYHWNTLLLSACSKSIDVIVSTLFHGVNEAFSTPSYSGTYYGPISTTWNYDIAKQFAGAQGRIFELYPTFARRGLKVSWLSNFPDEGEVLYMNTSFQIVNVYHSNVTLSDIIHRNDPLLNKSHILFEKAILKALHVINTESNVITFSDMQDLPPEQDFAFHRLDEHEQISILYLLYLQYNPKEWDKFWKKQNGYKGIAFAKYRDQFIVLAKNVKAVKMERMPMLIQHFFYESHKKYKFPFKSSIKEGIHHIEQQFIPNQPLRFETITRLFPNTRQLLINGNNFDWTLERLIKFMQKYDLCNVKLQDIEIRFIPQYPNFDEKYQADEEEAAKRLQANKTHKNISKLKKLGWIFASPCHLRRVGFEPLPELPFLVVFMPYVNEVLYRTYSRKILNRSLLARHKLIRMHTNGRSMTEDMSFTTEGPHDRRSYSAYSAYDRRSLRARSPIKTPAPISPPLTSPGMEPVDENGSWNGTRLSTRSLHNYSFAIRPLTQQLSTQSLESLDEKYDQPSYPASYEGQNPLVLNYNPKNCILSQDVMDKLDYKDDLIKLLFWRFSNDKIKKPNDETKKQFIKQCRVVQILVIDPMTPELSTLFTEIPNKKPIISFGNIYKLFPNVSDIFLRHTRLNLRIAYRIQSFIQNNEHSKLERIFFTKTTTIGQLQIPELLRILKPINFGFVENEQMVLRNTS